METDPGDLASTSPVGRARTGWLAVVLLVLTAAACGGAPRDAAIRIEGTPPLAEFATSTTAVDAKGLTILDPDGTPAATVARDRNGVRMHLDLAVASELADFDLVAYLRSAATSLKSLDATQRTAVRVRAGVDPEELATTLDGALTAGRVTLVLAAEDLVTLADAGGMEPYGCAVLFAVGHPDDVAGCKDLDSIDETARYEPSGGSWAALVVADTPVSTTGVRPGPELMGDVLLALGLLGDVGF